MKTKRGLILLLTQNNDHWVLPHVQENHEFIVSDDLPGAVKTLNNIRYDLIMLDDLLLREQIGDVVTELKRRFPTLPIVALTDNTDPDYYTNMIRAGVDDLLSQRLSAEELQYHVRLMLKQHSQNRALVQRNQNLHLVASLPRLLDGTSEPRSTILQAIRFISTMFRLEGVAIVLRENDFFRLYVGNSEFVGKNQLFESVLHPGDYDPFLWTIRSGLMQVFERIEDNPYYVPIPIMANASVAAIVPLLQGKNRIGAVGIFNTPGTEITNEELFIYEQFASQLSAVLRTAYQHHEQRLNLQTNQHLLNAWRAFADVHSPADVAEALSNVIADIPLVTRVVVWLHDEACVDNYEGRIVEQLPELDTEAMNWGLGYSLNGDSQPRVISLDSDPVLHPLLTAMSSPQVIAFPIAGTNDLLGSAFISVVEGYAIDSSLINHILQIAVYALERVHLNAEIYESHGRVLSILVSIGEGIFFVNGENQIAVCNPQVNELTHVPPMNFLNQDVDVLLRAIANEAQSPAHVYTQLQAAQESIRSGADEPPIVSVTLADGEEILIDFVKVFDEDDGSVNWVGVVRSTAAVRETSRFDTLFERLRTPFAQARSLVSTLAEEHGHLSYGERQRLLGEIENGIDRTSRQWDNVVDLYRLQYGGLAIQRQNVRVGEVIERLLNSRQLNRYYRQIQIDMPQPSPSVVVDEFSLERALMQFVLRAIDASPAGAPVVVRVANGGSDVEIAIEDEGTSLPVLQLDAPDDDAVNLGVYIAGELIRRNGGYVRAISNGRNVITMTLPSSAPAPELAKGDSTEVRPAAPALAVAATASRAPQREPNRIMLIRGRSKLSALLSGLLVDEDYEVIDYDSVEEALPALTEAYWDLIILDVKLPDRSGVEVCKRIRQRSEVPIMLVSDDGSGQEKADGLNAGADDYLTNPISDDELLARVRVIFNRRHIADRTSEPLLIDNLYIDFARRMVFLENEPVELTRIEYDLLYTLVMNKGQTVTHKQLLSQVWGPEHQGETQYLWVNISRLRKKLEPTHDSPRYIRTQPGVGYYFDAS